MTRGTSGFTLIELMVALLITSVIVATAHAGMTVVSDAWTRSRAARDPVHRGASARALLQGWLRSATLLEGDATFRGIHNRHAGRAADKLSFVAADGGPLRRGPHHVRLWIDSDPATPRRGLLAEVVPFGTRGATPAETLTVAPAAVGLALRYRATTEGREHWMIEWQTADRLPRAVELRILDVARTRINVGVASQVVSDLPRLLALSIVVPIDTEGWR